MSEKKPAATKRFIKPKHWTNEPPPKPKKVEQDEEMSPTRYGDWEKNGIAIDF